jgi:hypothetical protein
VYIERDLTLYSVPDFKKHVQPYLTDRKVAEEVYKGHMLIGWNVVDLYKEN